MSLFAVVPHTKEHIQNYMIKFINRLWIDFCFTLQKMRSVYKLCTLLRLHPPVDNTVG